MIQQLVLASGNNAKLRELSTLLAGQVREVIKQSDLGVSDAEETGLSFVENALLKARHAAQQTGLPALADDSGLVVPALQGQPGIYSARYAGSLSNSVANNTKLLQVMADLQGEQRQACFHCCIVYVQHANDPVPLIAAADWHGYILDAPRGEQGFGYDPVFYVPDYACSAAELAPEVKNRISHRAQAMQQCLNLLRDKVI